MRRLLGRVLFAIPVLLIAGALVYWPRVNDVETGRTPEYPDLQPRTYRASPRDVENAARAAIATMPRLAITGAGSGRSGIELQVVATTPVVDLKSDVTVRVTTQGGLTRLSIRSKSRTGPVDFGENARTIRALLAAVDARVRPVS